MNAIPFRHTTTKEKKIIERLLEVDFPGRDVILEQINNSVVIEIDENGSLKFDVKIKTKANVKRRIPIEAEYEDVDGITIHFLLHVVDGIVKELEIYKDDSSPIIKIPEAENLRLLNYD